MATLVRGWPTSYPNFNKRGIYFLGKYIYVENDGTTIYIKTLDDKDDATPTTILTLTCAAFTPSTTETVACLRVIGDTLYVLTVFARNNAATDLEINTNYTTDLAAWTEQVATWDTDNLWNYPIDVFELDGVIYAFTGCDDVMFLNFKTLALIDTIGGTVVNCSSGYVDLDDLKYYFVFNIQGAADKLYIYSFDGADIDTVDPEIIDEGTTDFECVVQQSHLFQLEGGNRVFLCGYDGTGGGIEAIYFYDARRPDDGWFKHDESLGVSDDHKIGLIWDDTGSIPLYVFVNVHVWRIAHNILVKQFPTESGFKTWGFHDFHGVYNDATYIKVISKTDFLKDIFKTNSAIYQIPTAEIISDVEPAIDEYPFFFTDAGVEIFEGYVLSYEGNTADFKYEMKSGIQDDLNEKVEETFIAKTWSYILKFIIDKYCDHLKYGTATISTTPATTYTITLNKTVLECFKTADKAEGYITSWRPDQTVYWDQFANAYLNEDRKINLAGVLQWGTANEPDLTDWTDTSGADTSVSIIAELDGHKNIMELDDQSGANRAEMRYDYATAIADDEHEFFYTKDNVGANMVGIMIFYDEDDNILIQLRWDGDDLDYYTGGAWHSIKDDFLVANVFSHFRIVPNDTANTFDIYIDGVLEGDDLAYRIASTTGIEYFKIYGDNADTGYKIYVDAIGAERDEYITDSNRYRLVNPAVPPGVSFDTPIKTLNLKFSRIIIYGGYVDGVRLKSVVVGDLGYGTWMDWFPEITNQTDLDLMSAQIASDKNVTIKKIKLGVISMGMFHVGTYYKLTFSKYSITAASWYILSVKYDAVIDESRFASADSYMAPSSQDMPVAIEENTNRTKNNEQDIANIENNIHYTWRDPAAWDYDKTDFVDDTNWNDFDISAIVGAKKMLVKIRAYGQDGVINSRLFLRTNGQTNGHNVVGLRIQKEDSINEADLEIETDSSGVLEFISVPKPTDWDVIQLVIRGYKDA